MTLVAVGPIIIQIPAGILFSGISFCVPSDHVTLDLEDWKEIDIRDTSCSVWPVDLRQHGNQCLRSDWSSRASSVQDVALFD